MTLKALWVCDTYGGVMRADKAADRSIYVLVVRAMIIYAMIFMEENIIKRKKPLPACKISNEKSRREDRR